MDQDDHIHRKPRGQVFRLSVLLVAVIAIGISMTVAGGFWGSGDSANPLDPTHFGAGTADSPYCRRAFAFWLQGPIC